MQIRLSRRHIFICLLLCSLFFTSYTGVLNTNGTVVPEANIFSSSSINGGSDHSSVNNGANSSPVDYISTTGSPITFYAFSLRETQWPNPKTNSNLLTAIIAAQIICLIYSLRLSYTNFTQFNSIQITAFLHKKDGMK